MTTCSPQVASGPLADLGYQEEVCYGDKPAVPNLKVCRRRSTSLGLSKDTYDSEEIRSDRMVSDSRHGIRKVEGDIVTEISPGAHADFYEALMGGVWQAADLVDITSSIVAPVVGSERAITIDGLVIADLAAAGYLRGDIINFAGTGEAELDFQAFQIIADNEVGGWLRLLPMNPQFDYSVLPVTITTGDFGGNARVPMGNIYRSFIFERAFTDIGSFITYSGNRFNTAAIDLPPTGIATSTFGLMGKDADPIAPASFDGVNEVVLTEAELTSLTFDADAGTVTAGAGDFLAAGIVQGDRVIFDGDGITDPQNRNPRTVIAVTATVITVAEAIQSGGPYTGPFTVTRVGLPDYAAAEDNSVLVAVSGAVIYKERIVGTITGMTLNIDNQMAGSEVVGSNTVPVNLWGNQAIVGGTMTVLFDRGGVGEQAYNGFDSEDDNVSIYLTLTSADGAVSFVMPRCKINTGTIGDAVAEGLPVACDYRALKPSADKPRDGVSQIFIVDTTVSGAAAPFSTSSNVSGGGSGLVAAASGSAKPAAPKPASPVATAKTKEDEPAESSPIAAE